MAATFRFGAGAAAVATVVVAVAPATPEAQSPAVRNDYEAWLAAAAAHEPGAADPPLLAIMAWPSERFDRMLRAALSTAETPSLQRALSLHTDIAIVEHATQRASADGGGLNIEVLDGRQGRILTRSLHWTIARDVARTLHKRPGQAASVVTWYRAVAAMVQAWADCGLLAAHLEAAHEVVGPDPLLALYQATLHQTYADPRLQNYVRVVRSRGATTTREAMLLGISPGSIAFTTGDISRGRVGSGTFHATGPGSVPVLPRAAKPELDDAERWLRRALSLDPALVEARIRLAHVLTASGEHAKAVETLGTVDAAALPPFSAFYAAMVLGRSEEHLGHYVAAGAAYDRAAALFPGRQSVAVGRSRVALALGRAADALTTMVAVAGPGTTERDDPWASYFRLHDPDAQTLLQAWRASLKQTPW